MSLTTSERKEIDVGGVSRAADLSRHHQSVQIKGTDPPSEGFKSPRGTDQTISRLVGTSLKHSQTTHIEPWSNGLRIESWIPKTYGVLRFVLAEELMISEHQGSRLRHDVKTISERLRHSSHVNAKEPLSNKRMHRELTPYGLWCARRPYTPTHPLPLLRHPKRETIKHLTRHQTKNRRRKLYP
jgi:hypothetical protein